jgi:23S rRNA pseudouridine2605 synthase
MNTQNNSKNLIAINKPKGYIVTRSDERGRKTVYDLLPDWAFDNGWMPIGRLDLESKWLLLFTQNGQIGNQLTKPGGCVKIYEIFVRGYVTDEHIQQAHTWVDSPHGILKALVVEKIWNGWAKTKLRVQIDEGKNRHIRRLFWAMKDPKFGTPLKVMSLTRVSIGSLELNIESGKWAYLSVEEEESLLKGLV